MAPAIAGDTRLPQRGRPSRFLLPPLHHLLSLILALAVTTAALIDSAPDGSSNAAAAAAASSTAASSTAATASTASKPGAAPAPAPAPSASGPPVSLLLHLTDVHLSVMPPPPAGGGDPARGPDLLTLAEQLLARWPLAGAVVTGDLTEAKDVTGRGLQYEAEWKEWQGLWRALSTRGGLPPGSVFDTRGNHDTFNSGSRCGPRDFFCRYSARAAAAAAAAATAGQARSNTSGPAAPQGPAGRVSIDYVYDPTPAPRSTTGTGDGNSDGAGVGAGGATGGTDAGGSASSCPAAVLVGVDASLDPGLRGPTNFLGVIHPEVLDELEERLTATTAQLAALSAARATDGGGGGATPCSPPYVAYGHYPLSTVGYPLSLSSALRKLHQTDDGGSPKAGGGWANGYACCGNVQEVLLKHGVSAYLSGHLHGAFGRRLHRLHAAPSCGGGGSSSSSSTTGSSRSSLCHMLELESVDWKYGRTVRLVTLDRAAAGALASGSAAGGAVGFADFVFHPPPRAAASTAASTAATAATTGQLLAPSPPSPVSPLEPFDATRVVGSHLLLLTSPPDARYSPQLWPAAAAAPAGGAVAAGAGELAEGQGDEVGKGGKPAAEASPPPPPHDKPGPGPAPGPGPGPAAAGASPSLVRVMVLRVAQGAAPRPDAPVYLRWSCVVTGEAAERFQSGSSSGSDLDPDSNPALHSDPEAAAAAAAAQQRAGEGAGSISSGSGGGAAFGWRPTSHGSSGGGSSNPLSHRRQLSGRLQMSLEYLTASHSTYVADLLTEESKGPSAAASPPPPSPPPHSGPLVPHPRDCPAGTITIQAHTGTGGGSLGSSSSSRSDAATAEQTEPYSATEQRLIHWHPPLQPPPASSSASSSARSDSRQLLLQPQQQQQQQQQQPLLQPAPLGTTALEWLVLGVQWHGLGVAAMFAQWALLMKLLTAPGLAALALAGRLPWQHHAHAAGASSSSGTGSGSSIRRWLHWLQHAWRRFCGYGGPSSSSGYEQLSTDAGGSSHQFSSVAAVAAADATAVGGNAAAVAGAADEGRAQDLAGVCVLATSSSYSTLPGAAVAAAAAGGGASGSAAGGATGAIKRSSSGSSSMAAVGSGGSAAGGGAGGGCSSTGWAPVGGSPLRRGGGEARAAAHMAAAAAAGEPAEAAGGKGGSSSNSGGGGRHGPRPPLASVPGRRQGCWRRLKSTAVAVASFLCRCWPLREVAAVATRHTEAWLVLVVFVAYFGLGPWFFGQFVFPEEEDGSGSSSGGGAGAHSGWGGWGFVAAHGIYMWPLPVVNSAGGSSSSSGSGSSIGGPRPSGGLVAAPSLDHAVIANALFLLGVWPVVLLITSVVGRWQRLSVAYREAAAADVTAAAHHQASAGEGQAGRAATAGTAGVRRQERRHPLHSARALLSLPQAAALVLVAALNAALGYKVWSGLGWPGLAAPSPALGWLLPAAALWLGWVWWREVGGGAGGAAAIAAAAGGAGVAGHTA